ncbi:MAG: UbiD family decarboxylase [Chloroflexi bacterium]|nr:UbiD family decarboxylase [Chloroflexota bacterium]
MPRDIRETIEFLAERGELLAMKNEVDPVHEVAGIQKSLDNRSSRWDDPIFSTTCNEDFPLLRLPYD